MAVIHIESDTEIHLKTVSAAHLEVLTAQAAQQPLGYKCMPRVSQASRGLQLQSLWIIPTAAVS